QVRKARGSVDASRSLDRPGLQSHCISGTAKQKVTADAYDKSGIGAGTHIGPGETARHHVIGRRKHPPRQTTTTCKAKSAPYGRHGDFIGLEGSAHVRCEAAFHVLKFHDDKANRRSYPTIENAHFRSRAPVYDGWGRITRRKIAPGRIRGS